MRLPKSVEAKHTGAVLSLPHLGDITLGEVFAENAETRLYVTSHPDVLVKVFDLDCGKPDEISYGPYESFRLELANFEDVLKLPDLCMVLPAYHGADIDYEAKLAWIAMEYLHGQDLESWTGAAMDGEAERDWLEDFRASVFETLSIMNRFHRHGIILIDFKPDNVIRLKGKNVKFVDLGALFMPRHRRDLESYLYSVTPDHSEVLIDASNLQSGVPPNEASDVFAAGVALFELATGRTRLLIDDQTADEILRRPEIFLFRDSQAKDIWHCYPHLKDDFPLMQTQLEERSLLFSEVWHLLKGYVGTKVEGWDNLDRESQGQILLATGTTFILEQLPAPLAWLAGPIAQSTVLRSLRLNRIDDLMALFAIPAEEYAVEDIKTTNSFVEYLRLMDEPVAFTEKLNSWEVKLDSTTEHWLLAAPAAFRQFEQCAHLVYLKSFRGGEGGARYFRVADEWEADDVEDRKLTLGDVSNDRNCWIG